MCDVRSGWRRGHGSAGVDQLCLGSGAKRCQSPPSRGSHWWLLPVETLTVLTVVRSVCRAVLVARHQQWVILAIDMAPSSASCTLAQAVILVLFLGSPVAARNYVNSDKTLEQAMREDVDLSQVCGTVFKKFNGAADKCWRSGSSRDILDLIVAIHCWQQYLICELCKNSFNCLKFMCVLLLIQFLIN